MSADQFPQIIRVRQNFDTPTCEDIASTVTQQLAKLHLQNNVRSGQRVAITAGSRGIANIASILKSAARYFTELGASPFIVPAMGSHGGGTAEGQRRVIESYGITEEFCGCPIHASMETVVIGKAAEGFPVFFDRHAHEADHVVVCGRVKPHTNFAGDIQSGLLKMLMIGLGKKDGAALYHQAIDEHGFPQIIRSVGPTVLAHANILAGLAIVENAEDQTAHIEAIPPDDFLDREKALLKQARAWMPSLPFSKLDVLVIDRIGKNISGTGMDTNIVGRKTTEPAVGPDIKHIIVRDLTPESHGNAAGIGFADFCLTRLVEGMDRQATVLNCLTACDPGGAKVPVDCATDQEALQASLSLIGLRRPRDARLVWIPNTLDLVEIECSTALAAEIEQNHTLEVMTEARPLPISANGVLPEQHFEGSS